MSQRLSFSYDTDDDDKEYEVGARSRSRSGEPLYDEEMDDQMRTNGDWNAYGNARPVRPSFTNFGDFLPDTLPIVSFQTDFAAGFAKLRASGELMDFTINVKKPARGFMKLRVHKCVLAVQSPVFAAMFKSGMSEQKTGEMSITEFSVEAVEQFIDSLYTGNVKNATTKSIELFSLSAKYDVPQMREVCKGIVIRNINQTNALDVLVLGKLHSEPEMQRKAFDVLKQTMPNVIDDDSLMNDPDQLKALTCAFHSRNKKMRQAEDEFESIRQNIKLKRQQK